MRPNPLIPLATDITKNTSPEHRVAGIDSRMKGKSVEISGFETLGFRV
jgi:hypothetical protein